MNSHLIVTALGLNSPEALKQFTAAIKDSGCNIEQSRSTLLNEVICLHMLLSGSWDSIAKFENSLPRLEQRLELSILCRRTSTHSTNNKMMPYAIEIVAFDQAGIVHDVVKFMLENKLVIHDLYSNTYKSNLTGAMMFSMHMTINIPADISIAGIRGDFIDFCDQLNLDAIMEPVK
jgi:glycine cleavage system transcriptional repressor